VQANSGANTNLPSNATVPGGGGIEGYGTPPNSNMNPAIVGIAGGSQPHTNMQPFLVINFCIAVTGIFPSRN
jgi:microcystin-dependent protein